MLKRKNHQALCESLVYLKDETSSFLNESEKIKFQWLTDYLKKNPCALFPFTLLNEDLVQFAQDNAVDDFKACISDFTFNEKLLKDPFSVFPFGKDCFDQAQWSRYEQVLTSEFPEKSYIKAPSKTAFNQSARLVQDALHEIEKISPDYFSEVEALVSNVLIVNSNRFIAGSSFTLLGLVSLADNHDFNMTVEYLVHETAHQYLYNLTVFDELCSGVGMHTSPLRKDPRPIEGIYHAVFVLARLMDFYNRALRTETLLPKDFMERQLSHYRLRYKDAYDLLLEKATLTDLGRDLLRSSKEMAS